MLTSIIIMFTPIIMFTLFWVNDPLGGGPKNLEMGIFGDALVSLW